MKYWIAVAGLLLATPGLTAEDCINELDQDLNCNYIDVSLEEDIDLSDATCLATVDDEGNPYPNADYYYDYTGINYYSMRNRRWNSISNLTTILTVSNNLL